MHLVRGKVTLIVALCPLLPIAAQSGGALMPAALTATRIHVAPTIDGSSSDVAWATGPSDADFRQFAPLDGAPATLRSEVRVRYDDRALYFFVRAYDPCPDSIVRRLSRRDTFDATADQVRLLIDPLHDRRTGYDFIVTASGVQSDAALFDDGKEDYSWDGIWRVATRIDSLGWTAEFAVPFSQLRFAEHRAPTFGIFVARWVGRSGERASIPHYSRALPGLVSQMGTLGGLRDLAPPATLVLSPYALARARNLAPAPAQTGTMESRATFGGDVKWLPRPNLSLDATLNPDFGQVEADPAVLNLSGVEVFQPERRPFFLEGASLLTLPLADDGSGQLFYTRRIGQRPLLLDQFGAADSQTETRILGAAKVTAHPTPSTSVAALSAITDEAFGRWRPDGTGKYLIEPRASALVFRVQQSLRAGRSSIGLMVTRLDRDADSVTSTFLPSSSRAAAITAQQQTSDGVYQASAWLLASDVRGSAAAIAQMQLSTVHAYQRPDDRIAFDSTRERLRGRGGFISVGKVGGGISRFSASYRRIDPGVDVNDLGFLTVSGVQGVSTSAGIARNTPGQIAGIAYRRSNLSLALDGNWSTAGLAYDRGFTLTGGFQLANLALVQATVTQQLPGAFCSVSCTRGGPAVVDPPRATAVLDFTGDPRRAFVAHANLEVDRDDEGRSHAMGVQLDATWRIRSNLDASLAAHALNEHKAWFYYGQFGDATSDTTHFAVARLDVATRSITARVNYALSTSLTLQWYGQAHVSRGEAGDLRELADPRSADWTARFRPYGDSTLRSNPGGIDFKRSRSNAVLRWEYRPGSSLFVVWTQGRDVDGRTAARIGLWPSNDFRELFTTRPKNVIAIKVSYRVGH